MQIVGRTLFRTTHWLRRSNSLELLAQLRANPRLPRDAAATLQLELLRRLLTHAEQTVPYYRQVFRERGFSAADLRGLADFEQLPILTKDIVREHQRDLISERFDESSLLRHHSGGSTGAPLTFFHDPAYVQYSDAGTYRTMEQAGWHPGEMVAFFWAWNDRLNKMSPREFALRQWLRRSYQFDAFHASEADMREWVKVWGRIRPKVVYGYASTVARFAKFLLASGIELEPLRGAFTTAETLFPEQRRDIEQAFRCRVFDCYGSSEIRNIAAECVAGRMHVNVDYVVLELDRRQLTPDGTAPFILTSLRSFGMPFIRYRNEDCGRLVDEPCECGSGFPLLDLRIGRVNDHFVFPDGRVVHGLFLTYKFYGSEGIELFQFHQTSPSTLVLWIVPTRGNEAARRRSLDRVRTEIGELSGGLVQLDVREVESIPLSPAGKHRYTRSDVSIPVT